MIERRTSQASRTQQLVERSELIRDWSVFIAMAIVLTALAAFVYFFRR